MDPAKKAILRAIVYARVSTDDQAERGYSLPSQLEACRKYAERLGFTVIAEFTEDYSGATPIAERPEGKKVIEMLKRREADVVIVYQVDRLSRDIVDLLARVQMWTRAGVQIHACDMGRIENELDIVLVIKGWQGSDERRKIIERTSRGRNGKAQRGKVVGSGFAPYGYAFVHDDGGKIDALEILEREAKVIRMIYALYLKDRLKVNGIARRLSRMGIPTPGERYSRPRRRGSAMWHSTSVLRILTNELYAGTWHYGETIGKFGRGGRRPLDQQIAVKVPAIIDGATWRTAQAQIECNKLTSKRNAQLDYPLRGRIKCGQCDGALVGMAKHDNSFPVRYYRCGRANNFHAGIEQRRCSAGMVLADVLESKVWEWLGQKIRNRNDFQQLLCEARDQELQELEPKREELDAILEQIKQSEKDALDLADALSRVPKGGLVEKNLLINVANLEVLYAAQTKRRDELQAAINARALTDENFQIALRFQRDFETGWDHPTPEDIQRALEILRVTVTVKDKKARVKCLIPAEDGVIDVHTCRRRRWCAALPGKSCA